MSSSATLVPFGSFSRLKSELFSSPLSLHLVAEIGHDQLGKLQAQFLSAARRARVILQFHPVSPAVSTKPSRMKSLGGWGVSDWNLSQEILPITCFGTENNNKKIMAIQ